MSKENEVKYKVYRFIGDIVTSDYDCVDARQKAEELFGRDIIVEQMELKK